MKTKELHELTVDELNTKLKELTEELFNLRFRHAIGQLENPASLKTCKKDIAKVKTIIRERELGLANSPAPVSETKKVAKKARG